MFSWRSLVANVEIKPENMDTSAQFQTPAQNIRFIDLTVDSLECFYKNIGSRQNEDSQWIHLWIYHLETTALTGFRILHAFEWQAKAIFRWERLFLPFTGWPSCISICLVRRLCCFALSVPHLPKLWKVVSDLFNGYHRCLISLLTVQLTLGKPKAITFPSHNM